MAVKALSTPCQIKLDLHQNRGDVRSISRSLVRAKTSSDLMSAAVNVCDFVMVPKTNGLAAKVAAAASLVTLKIGT
jgi:hypothetical protein